MKKIEIATTDGTLTNAYFIESEYVKVFPCSYRGFKKDENGNQSIFDPEASGFTEYNFANIYGKQTKLISWSGGFLKCIIDGYYFEISGIAPANLWIDNNLYKFAIVLKPIGIVGSYETKVLDSINGDNKNYLDTKIGDDNTYYFTGLALIPEGAFINGAVYFSPCKSLTNKDGTKTAVIDWQAYRLTDALTTGSGDGSVRMLGTVKKDKSTTCYATGENAFAIGNTTGANGDFSIAGGIESTANYKNSIAIGDHVNTSADNQVVFGSYNKENTEAALIIGNGISTDKKNILEISKAGDINAAGKLDIAGNISSSNGGITLEKNGFISVYHSYEYQKIHDTATYDSTISYYEKNAETAEMTEKAVTAETFASLKNNLYIKVHHLSSLDNNGNLLVDGNAQVNKKLTIKEQAEIDGDITGQGNLTINGDGKTHALTIGSNGGTGDYGSITVYGKKLAGGQETKITTFSVDDDGAATIAKTLTVGTNKLVVNDDSVSINNEKVTVATGTTTINNTLTVNGTATITDTITDNNKVVNVVTTINKDKFDYNSGKFTVTNAGNITAKSLTLADGYKITNAEGEETIIHYGITEDGKITGSELTLKDGYKIAADGNATLKDLIINNATLDGIKLEKGSYTVKDTDGTRAINNIDALKITKYIENSDSGMEEATQGLHVNGKITAAGDFAIGESVGESNDATTKITQGGTAYFKQGLLVGGKVTGANESDDTVTFRVAPFSSEAEQASYADLKGNLNIKKYTNRAGNLTVEGDTKISGSLTIGSISFNKNNITGIARITATQFNATSDIRKKTAIKDYICKKSILDLPIKEFEFIGDETHTKHIGCIAQDLQEICPEIVHEDKDGYLSIEETKLVYLLLQEVKELKKEIKALKGE